MTLPTLMKTIERALILNELELHGGNQTHAAAALGVPLPTLNQKIGRLGLPRGRRGKPRRMPAEDVNLPF